MMLPRVMELDRRAVRRRFEERFSSTRMATDYVAVYRSLLERRPDRSATRLCRCSEPYWIKG